MSMYVTCVSLYTHKRLCMCACVSAKDGVFPRPAQHPGCRRWVGSCTLLVEHQRGRTAPAW